MCELFSAEAYQHLTLRDGRRLGYVDCGHQPGRPLFYFHAFRFCKFGRLPHQIAKRLGIRLIAPDRPGFGLSDFKPGRTLKDWAGDIAELADALHIGQFSVAGHSGGSPYAAVCAHQLPGRVNKAAMFSSIGLNEIPPKIKEAVGELPLSYHLNRIAITWAANVYLRVSGRFGSTSRVLSMAGSSGVALISAPLELTQFISGLGDAASRGRRFGSVWELSLYARPWGFRFEDIKTEMQVWHGEADRTIPAPLIRAMVSLMPNCRAWFLPSEDHFSLVSRHMAEILSAVVA